MTDKILIDRTVAEFAVNSIEILNTGKWAQVTALATALRAGLEQPQGEQEAAPNGATHIQLQQGAFYKRVDGKWYVWSLMKNGEPHRWYISPGTAESCLEPLATTPKQKREPLTDEQVMQAVRHLYQSDFAAGMGFPDDLDVARAIEAAHNIKD